MRIQLLALCSTLFLAATVALAQSSRPAIKWNNPDAPKVDGIDHHSLQSEIMHTEMGYAIFLPKEARRSDGKRFPVIYFLHGAGGNENSDGAGFSEIVRKLIDERTIAPVICVFPNGGMSGYRDSEERGMVESFLIKELIPYIDKTYPTIADREHRVLIGFSMGGGGAIRLGLKYPELFSAAGSWAAALGRRGPSTEPAPPEYDVEHLKSIKDRPRLLMIVGEKDMTLPSHQPVLNNLKQADYPVQYETLKDIGHDLGAYYRLSGEKMVRFVTEDFGKP